MRHLTLGLALLALGATPAFAQPGPAAPPASILVVLVDGNPNAGGAVLAVSPVEAPASREVQSASYTALRLGARRFVFAIEQVAPVGSPVGSTLVRLREGRRPLFEVAALLSAALAGRTNLVILTQGTLVTGVVTAVVPLDPQGGGRVATGGATQATIFQGGQETTVVIERGRAGPSLVVDGSERGSECRFCDGMGGMP
jgi:hypothetical protein